jgi:tRNA A37 threonylcarbamoyladenosine biosynthesis protein TsaE
MQIGTKVITPAGYPGTVIGQAESFMDLDVIVVEWTQARLGATKGEKVTCQYKYLAQDCKPA